MQTFHALAEVNLDTASVCTVGTFDGVHLGHQHLLRSVLDDAHTRGLPAAVITFHPHPRIVLGRAPALYLTLPGEKAGQMELLGVDVFVVMTFDRQTMLTTAAEFVRMMVEHLHLASLWIGPDFALGNKRQGDAAYLKEQGAQYGFAVNVISPVSAGAEEVSSTRIRAALARGDMREAALCLGRPFRVTVALASPRTVRVPEQHALPAPGRYQALVCGAPEWVSVPGDASADLLCLEHPLHCETSAPDAVEVDFLEHDAE